MKDWNFEHFFALGLVVLAITAASFIGVNSYHSATLQAEQQARHTQAKSDAMKGGVDPLAVHCAFDGPTPACMALAMKAAK